MVHALPGVRLRALALIGLSITQLWLCLPYAMPAGYLGTDPVSAGLFSAPGMPRQPFVEPGYFPATSPPRALGVTGLWQVVAGEATVQPVRVTDAAMALDVTAPAGARLTLHVRAFPGWHARLDDVPLATAIDPATGFLVTGIPAGRHRLEARFEDTAVRQVSNGVSARGRRRARRVARPGSVAATACGGLRAARCEPSDTRTERAGRRDFRRSLDRERAPRSASG